MDEGTEVVIEPWMSLDQMRRCLRVRWEHLLAFKLPAMEGGTSRPSFAPFSSIAERYDEPWRHYHNLSHLADCFKAMDKMGMSKDELVRLPLLELAIFFHDIETPMAPDGPEKSALMAERFCQDIGLPDEAVRCVGIAIQSTTYGKRAASLLSREAVALINCDLYELGASPQVFLQNTRNVVREARECPERRGQPEVTLFDQAKVLMRFRRPIYINYSHHPAGGLAGREHIACTNIHWLFMTARTLEGEHVVGGVAEKA